MKHKTIVIGAGPAGLIAAVYALRRGASVTVVEKMPSMARKLKITGKGRCNLTNDTDLQGLLGAVRRNPKFLYSAFAGFSPADTMNFFEELGVPLKVERGSRVFPVSDKAFDVAAALIKCADDCGASFLRAAAAGIKTENGAVTGVKLKNGDTIAADNVIIATGGLSYPATGSTGDGYAMALALGHTVIPPRASLVPLDCLESWCAALEGLSLKNVTLTFLKDGKRVFSQLGEMLFTDTGIGGPLTLTASAYYEPGHEWTACIDLKPGLDREQLDRRILRDFEERSNRDFSNSLDALLPKRMAETVVNLSGIDPTLKVNRITRVDRERLVGLLKCLPLSITGTRPIEEAVVTAGGISTAEIDPKTMRSKLVNGLYFAGEVIDVDAVTGGFNLQIAFSTGVAAGRSVSV